MPSNHQRAPLSLCFSLLFLASVGVASAKQAQAPANMKPQGPNIIINGDFSLGNKYFSSSLPYIDPGDNCLWGGYYTVAPSFVNPFLHHLVMPAEYAAPNRPNKNEQVFFANAGGKGAMDLWSTVVQCKPNTAYRISFKAISLSGTKWQGGYEVPTDDWLPTFSITVDDVQSKPQTAGPGRYFQITSNWESKGAKSATITITRLNNPHGGGLVGIANIEMVATGTTSGR